MGVRGAARLRSARPRRSRANSSYTFDQCEAYTREILANVEARGVALGPRHAFLLERLTKQFVGTRDRPEDRWSKPVYTVREEERFAALDVSVGASVRKNPDQKKGEADGLAIPGILVGLGHNVTMETNYRLVMAPERGETLIYRSRARGSEAIAGSRRSSSGGSSMRAAAGGTCVSARVPAMGKRYARGAYSLQDRGIS